MKYTSQDFVFDLIGQSSNFSYKNDEFFESPVL